MLQMVSLQPAPRLRTLALLVRLLQQLLMRRLMIVLFALLIVRRRRRLMTMRGLMTEAPSILALLL